MTAFEYVMAFLKEKRDAPNYREASQEQKKLKKTCATCKAWNGSATDDPKTGYCKWYDFNCNADNICDAWVKKE